MSDHPTDEAVQSIASLIIERCQNKRETLEQAARFVRTLGVPGDAVTTAVDMLRDRQLQNSVIADTVVGTAARADRWYLGPIPHGEWDKYRHKWLQSGKPALDYMDESTTRITGLLANPATDHKRKGLVVGNVQSGKTGNFAGVIAKAADAGYRVVIVMAGVYNNLRAQTQLRLEHDVFGDEWELRTDDVNDIGVLRSPARSFKTRNLTALVVKKNPTRLQNLLDALRGLPEEHRRQLPILIIDDEADQATPNSPSKKTEVSTINGLMRDIWREVRVGTYLAYTATPFANVLMAVDDKDELFPSDFITSLRPGPTYFGAERVFGIAEGVDDEGNQTYADGLDMVRQVPEADVADLRPKGGAEERADFIPPIVDSLADALRWFVIATAIRRIRGDEKHSSMLIHTTHFAAPHMAMQGQIQQWMRRQSTRADWSRFRKLWETEADKVVPDQPRLRPTWDQIEQMIPVVLSDLKVIVDNGISDDRLDYTKEEGQTVVAVGGGTLSRGLTLEGLVVSYFTRSTNTYDTLMQMGRWFGYRDGYEDLPRIWVSEGLDKDYAFLARVERDLREEIASIEGTELTPEQVGVRVRHHPGRLEITSVNRMRSAQLVQVSLSGQMKQSFILDGTAEVRQANLSAIENLLSQGLQRTGGGRLRAAASTDQVATFLRDFRAHADQGTLSAPEQRDAMQQWLANFGSDCSWTVVVAENTATEAVSRLQTTMIGGERVGMVNRAPLSGSTTDRVDFKAVMSPGDWVADIPSEVYPDGRAPSDGAGRRRARRQWAKKKGLVVIYPISHKSAPTTQTPTRQAMPEGVTGPVYAFAIIFPTVDDRDGSDATYVSVRPNPNAVADEYVEENVEDTEGSKGDDD